MLFAITNLDKPNSFDLRAATREVHLGYLDGIMGIIVIAGALLNADSKPIGSMLVIDVPDQDAAAAIAAGDPYAKVDLFASVTIAPYRVVYKDGARAAA
jgi:uncharacterized protein